MNYNMLLRGFLQSAEAQVAAASQADATREDVVLVVVDVGAEETQIGTFLCCKSSKRERSSCQISNRVRQSGGPRYEDVVFMM